MYIWLDKKKIGHRTKPGAVLLVPRKPGHCIGAVKSVERGMFLCSEQTGHVLYMYGAALLSS